MTLSLACRAARPSLLAGSVTRVSLTAVVSSRYVSLSAIHKGLVESEKARPQGPRADKLSSLAEGGAKRMTYAERQKAREQLARERPTYKIRKGKKDITEYPDKAKPKPRGPSVYQLKAKKLHEELKTLLLAKAHGESPDSPFQPTGPRPDLADRPRRTILSRLRARDSARGGDTEDVKDVAAELRRTSTSGVSSRAADSAARVERAPPSRDADSFRADRGASRRDRGASAPRSSSPSQHTKDREPLSIPYTTAASQFLYGKAVVEAALRASRRKLYKLYIYGGANRQNASDDALIQGLAKRRGVPVTIMGEDGARLMDKMASSRPHNGFVLEASPLPQPPVTALGPGPDDYAARPGYRVELGHQSAEEAAINGRADFFPAPAATHRPLVVVLDRVLDPGNLGAILRTVAFLGAAAVGITRRGSATLTPVALKASAGAAETLPLFSIASLPDFLSASRANGWTVYAAVAEAPPRGAKQRRNVDLRDIEEADPLRREPCVLLLGNEGEGLSRFVVQKADYEVNIPNMSASAAVDSLNVSVAAGLLCSAFLKGTARARELAVAEGTAKQSLW
ncbi:6a7bd6cb-4911-4b59-960b-2f010ebedabf [Thermothielavioides terrestris]|uniref:rRNA methyltransferase 1, mitochondrial n=1 Tax=Thermothielavioides terrestris TaxID=2587410 RepID=A0A3S4ANM3_9PEZI|nr:6a7bd6cb-4911-4b59-960b-2f010ebedabf [Thermothielavioides terrestris]